MTATADTRTVTLDVVIPVYNEEHDLAAAQPEIVAKLKSVMKQAYTPHENWKFPAADGAGQGKAKKK